MAQAIIRHPARVVLALGLSMLPAAVGAQGGLQLLPGGELPGLHVAPREPYTGVRGMVVAQAASAFGTGAEWEVAFGHGIPFIRLSGDEARGLLLGLQAGVFGRFVLETKKRDLISSDWVFAVPVFVVRETWWVRFRYHHVSAHLGDDYIDRFAVEREGYLRDVLGVMAHRQAGRTVGVYAGVDHAFNVEPNENRRWSVTGGMQFHDARRSGVLGGVHVYLDEDVDWTPRLNMQVGVRVKEGGPHNLRVLFDVMVGSSTQALFRRSEEVLLSAGAVVEF